MKKLTILKKVLSFAVCLAISSGTLICYNSISDKPVSSDAQAAKSLTEIQAERDENNRKIAEYEEKINALQGSQNSEQEYQNTLNAQIAVIQDNIRLLNIELDSIQSEIDATQTNITNLEKDIDDKQVEIDESIEEFKQRMCAMYISGNDNIASIIVGSSSFYDIMSRVEMANRMAEYDQELIDGILSDIRELDDSKKQLETDKLTFEMQLENQKKRKDEKQVSLDSLDEKVQATQAEIDRLEREKQAYESSKNDLKNLNASLDAQEQEWLAAIEADKKRREEEARQKAEEERKRKEEEERKKKEEEERKKQEEEERKKQEELATATTEASGEEETTVTSYEEENTTESDYEEPSYEPEPVSYTENFAWPCPGYYYITSNYGARWGRNHNGIDVGDGGIHGGAAVASRSGTVIAVSNSCTHDYPKDGNCCGNGYGNYVLISHDGTYSTLYAHLSSVTVSVGDTVSQGQTVGYIGCTGFSTGDHLHFEVRENGVAYNPLNYVSR